MAYRNPRISITAVGGKQVQANWNETDPNSPAYIANKPDVSGQLTRQVVDELPTEDIDPNCIYMVPNDDHYDEYMYINGNWEQIGSTQVEQVQSDWTEADPTSPAFIDNKPSLATVATSGDYTDLTNTPSLATVATSGDYDDLTNKPTIPAAQVNSDWNASTGVSQILNKPSLATVATSGAYSDLSGTPSLATVATSGDYDDLTNKPTIPTVNDGTVSFYNGINNSLGSITMNQSTTAIVDIKPATQTVTGTPAYIAAVGGKVYKCDTNLTALVVNTAENNSVEALIYFHTSVSGCTLTLPNSLDMVVGNTTLVADKDYIISIKDNVAIISNASDLLAPVAYSGSYSDLSNTPTIPAAQVNSDWNSSTGVSEILNKPSNLVFGSLFGSPASYTIMYISQSDYDNLGTYDNHTIYMIY